MIIREHYDFYKYLYEREGIRSSNLVKKGEIYLSLQSILLSAVFFKIKDVFEIFKAHSNISLDFIIFTTAMFFLLISILFNVWALQITKYQRIHPPRKILLDELRNSISKESFYLNRIVDYTIATERNQLMNNNKAKKLKLSVFFLALGLCTIVLLVTVILKP